MGWINAQGEYYEGDRASLSDRGVPQRPSPIHIFVDGAWIEDAVKVAEIAAEEARIAAKAQDIANNLPSWAEISNAIDAATTIAALKIIIKKMARVLYWIAKDKAT